jgi:hypothetical protein
MIVDVVNPRGSYDMNSLLVDPNRWASFSSIQLILLHTSILFIYDATLLGLGHFPSHCDDHPSPKDDNLVRLNPMESSPAASAVLVLYGERLD